MLITKFTRRRLDRDPRDGRALRADAGASAGTTTGSRAELGRRRRRGHDAARRGCTRSCWSPSCTSRRCGRWPTPGRPGPSMLEAVTVDVDPDEHRGAAGASGTRRGIPVPLKVLDSPYREITRPIVDYVTQIRAGNPRDVVDGLHPRVRRRPLVGAAAAQPERAAAQGPAAVHPGRHGRLGAVAAALVARAPRTGSTASRPGRCAAASQRPQRPSAPSPRPMTRRPRRRGRRRARGSTIGAGRPRRPLRRPARRAGGLRPARAARRAGPVAGHRGRRTATASCARDAVEVLDAVARPGRPPPCPYAGPGRCGGCDFQHVDLRRPARAQGRRGRASSCAGWPALDRRRRRSRRCPGDADGLRLAHPGRVRRRRRRAGPGCAGTARTRSSRVDDCLHRHPRRRPARGSLERRWPGAEAVDVVDAVGRRAGRRASRSDGRRRSGARRRPSAADARRWSGEFAVSARGFWQVHPGAADTARRGRARAARARGRASRPLDLYAGVGLFAGAPGRRASGPTGGSTPSRPTPRGRARRAAQPRRPAAGSTIHAATVDRCAAAAAARGRRRRPRGARPAAQPAPGAAVVARDRRAASARGRLRRLRPGRAGPRRRPTSPSLGYRLDGAAGLRPVPDDPPRRVRRALRAGLTASPDAGLAGRHAAA